MKKMRAVANARPHTEFRPMTLGWKEFAILAVLIALILLLSGFAVWPAG
jgi:hypothetical protein